MKKKISKKDVEQYLIAQGTSRVALFGDSSYFRYTKEGSDILEQMFTHFSDGWHLGKKGLQIQSPDDPAGFLAHPKVQSMSDLDTLNKYLDKLNELNSDREMHLRLMKKGLSMIGQREKPGSIEEQVQAFLKENNSSLEDLFDGKRSVKERTDLMNRTLKHVAKTYVTDNHEIVIVHFNGVENTVAQNEGFNLEGIENMDHFLHLVKGCKQNRDLSYFIASPFVREGKQITRESIDQVLKERFGTTLEEVVSGKGLSASDRIKQLDSLHFYLSESSQDKDNDIVAVHPDDERKTVSFKNIENKEQYYESITTVDDFIKKVKLAREYRDNLYRFRDRLKRMEEKEDRGKDMEEGLER